MNVRRLPVRCLEPRRLQCAEMGAEQCHWRAQVEKQKLNLARTRAKGEDEMQMTIKTMQHKENKLTCASQ